MVAIAAEFIDNNMINKLSIRSSWNKYDKILDDHMNKSFSGTVRRH